MHISLKSGYFQGMEEGGLLTDLLFGEDADLSFDIPLPGLSAQGSAHANTGNKRARESSKTSTAQLEAQKRWREKQKNVAEVGVLDSCCMLNTMHALSLPCCPKHSHTCCRAEVNMAQPQLMAWAFCAPQWLK